MEKGESEKRFPFESFSGNELPRQVFSKNNDEYCFFEFAHAFSDRTWRLLSTLAAVNNEREVLCRAAAPDANYYYQKNFGVPAEFSFSIDESAGVYVDTMHCWPAIEAVAGLSFSVIADGLEYTYIRMRCVSPIEKWLIEELAKMMLDSASLRLLEDLDNAKVASAVVSAGTRITFAISGYDRPPYYGQHPYGIEGKIKDVDGAEVSIILHADQNDRLLELEFIRWGGGPIKNLRPETFKAYS